MLEVCLSESLCDVHLLVHLVSGLIKRVFVLRVRHGLTVDLVTLIGRTGVIVRILQLVDRRQASFIILRVSSTHGRCLIICGKAFFFLDSGVSILYFALNGLYAAR